MKNFRLLPFLLLITALLPLALYIFSASATLKRQISFTVSNDPQINLAQSLSGLKGAYNQWVNRIYLSAVHFAQKENLKKFLSAKKPSLEAFKVFGRELVNSTQLPLVILTDKNGNDLFDNQNVPHPVPSPETGIPAATTSAKPLPDKKKSRLKTKPTPALISLLGFPGLDRALQGNSLTGFFNYRGSLYEGSLVPVTSGNKTLGVVILGVLADQVYVDNLKHDVINELALYTDTETFCSRPIPAPSIDFRKRMEFMASGGHPKPPLQVEWSHLVYLADGFPLYDLDLKPAAFIAAFQPVKETLTVAGFPQKTIAKAGLWFLLLALLLSAGAVWLFMVPFNQLMEAVAQIKLGNLNAKLPVNRRDEIGLMARSLSEMVESMKETDRVSLILGKVVSPLAAKKILESRDLFAIKGERRDVTLLHADLRGFNTLSENMTPQNLVEALNQYFSLINEIVFKYEGMLDRFMGDAAIAVWGAPIPHEDKEWRAVQAALEIQEALKDFNISRIKKGNPPFTVGIGIHTGTVVSGNLGSEKRYDYTVIGEPLHIATRLCAMATPGQTVVSEETFEKVKKQVEAKPLNPIAVKGSMESLKTYEITKIL